MSQNLLIEPGQASPADVRDAPWCQSHWADLSTRSGVEAPHGRDRGTKAAGAVGATAAPLAVEAQVAL